MNSGTSVVLDYPGKLYYTNKKEKKDYANKKLDETYSNHLLV